jgi:DNA-binding protein H-NS
MLANPIGDWFKRWGIWILLALAAIAFIAMKLIPAPKGAVKIVDEAREATQKLKDQKAEEHAAITKQMEERVTELVKIKEIPDEEKRLAALAEFANRGKKP